MIFNLLVLVLALTPTLTWVSKTIQLAFVRIIRPCDLLSDIFISKRARVAGTSTTLNISSWNQTSVNSPRA